MLKKQSFSASRKEDYLKKLPQIVAALKKGYKPEKIILFGSMIDSKTQSNDIDLFLIKKTLVSRLGKRATEAWSCLPAQNIPVDFLIYTPSEVEYEINRGNVFISEILQKGKVLYG
ncbi:MAG: nucleotidyltransferase domain-containing protein [Patescibacteria group bacterium]|nr:nucleotidyltransferase domain-containing protein [Patescibacteria group bacterium]MCL5095645.1 nucleotidyltransferase domain-containing protein [Patescibacteria group bacterium]